MSTDDPHHGQPHVARGPDPVTARATFILVHGRNATAKNILTLIDEVGAPDDVAFVAPQAAGATWYPQSFLAPMDQNQPFLGSALRALEALVEDLGRRGVGTERIGLLGFSQGACLSLEFAARHARRYAAIVGLSGGLIGPPGTPRDYAGSFAGTRVFLGCSDVDAHIPLERVRETGDVLTRMRASVDMRIYPKMGHLVNQDERDAVSAMLRTV